MRGVICLTSPYPYPYPILSETVLPPSRLHHAYVRWHCRHWPTQPRSTHWPNASAQSSREGSRLNVRDLRELRSRDGSFASTHGRRDPRTRGDTAAHTPSTGQRQTVRIDTHAENRQITSRSTGRRTTRGLIVLVYTTSFPLSPPVNLVVRPQPHCAAIASAIPANVRLLSRHRFSLGGILWTLASRPSTMFVGSSFGNPCNHKHVAFVSPCPNCHG